MTLKDDIEARVSEVIWSAISEVESVTLNRDGENMWFYEDEEFSFGTFGVHKTSYHWRLS